MALVNGSSTADQFPVSSQRTRYNFNLKKDVSKPSVCLNILAWSSGVCIHQQCATNLNKTPPFDKYSPYVPTPLLNHPGRGLNRYDIWQLGYSPFNQSELYIALEKYPHKDIAKLLSDGLTSGFKINYTGPRLPLDTKKIKSVLQYPVAAYEKVEN